MTVTINSTRTAAVDQSYFWQPIATCPRGVKVQLMPKFTGVALYGQWNGTGPMVAWAPLPKRPEWLKGL